LISGESIARQIIYGQKYNQAKFGAVTKVSWLPDTFGFCQQLPQLLKQGGIDYFVTQKFLWNDTNQFPHQLFWWESPDGSRVLSLMSSPIGEGIDPLKMMDYACQWQTSTGINESLYLFGVGDHGGGPTRDMLEIADRWSQSDVFPDLKFTTAVDYLDKLTARPDSQSLPVWQDELYLEFHRGCFTTHADQKRSNRQCEDLLYQAELWSSLACIINHQPYSKELELEIETAWKQTLFNQFHDIIPGTAIEPVYITANESWENVERVTTQMISDALGAICDQIDISNSPIKGAMPIVVFNALNWKRTEVVDLSLPPTKSGAETWVIYDDAGTAITADLSRQTASAAAKILFLAEDLPSVGYKLFWLVPYLMIGQDPIENLQRFSTDARLINDDLIIQNQFVRVEIDLHTGDIARIWDKINQREILTCAGNQLQAFQDGGQYWDAWNIDPKYADNQLASSQLRSIKWIERGKIRQCLRVIRELAGCEFTQDYLLDAHSPILRIETSVDWQAEHILIKVNFPLNLTADISTAESACSSISHPTQPETPIEKAKWELPMHRWVDLTDRGGEYGVSILNNCKYGFDAGSDFLRLTLLRSSNWPDPTADRGQHRFTYAIYPHSDNWQAAQTVRKGLELNSSLQVVQVNGQTERRGDRETGRLKTSNSLIDLQAENLVLIAFKPADLQPQSWILRCYECQGIEGKIALTGDLNLKIDRVVNLLEEPQLEAIDSSIKPWQIRSFGCST
jgi:alpha-mannosidase